MPAKGNRYVRVILPKIVCVRSRTPRTQHLHMNNNTWRLMLNNQCLISARSLLAVPIRLSRTRTVARLNIAAIRKLALGHPRWVPKLTTRFASKLVLVFLFMLAAEVAAAQTVSGTVRDAQIAGAATRRHGVRAGYDHRRGHRSPRTILAGFVSAPGFTHFVCLVRPRDIDNDIFSASQCGRFNGNLRRAHE
jgi:hypothetical protein